MAPTTLLLLSDTRKEGDRRHFVLRALGALSRETGILRALGARISVRSECLAKVVV